MHRFDESAVRGYQDKSHFRKWFYDKIETRWRGLFLNYDYLRSVLYLLEPFKNRSGVNEPPLTVFGVESPPAPSPTPTFNSAETQYIAHLKQEFEFIFKFEIEKYTMVYKFLHNRVLKEKMVQIIFNVRALKVCSLSTRELEKAEELVVAALYKFFEEVVWLETFVKKNVKCGNELLKKYSQFFTSVGLTDQAKVQEFFTLINSGSPTKGLASIPRIYTMVETMLIKLEKKGRSGAIREALHRIQTHSSFAKSESFWVGILFGVVLLGFVVTIFVLVQLHFFQETGSDFVNFLLPNLRGNLILYLYLLFFGVNVYIWNRLNIDYKAVLSIEHEFSSAFQLMRTALVFLIIWFIFFLYCAVSFFYISGPLSNFFSKKASTYMAPLLWVFFIVYLFFPSKRVFNYSGRKWFFGLLTYLVTNSYKNFGFLGYWVVRNSLFFITVMADFLYSCCYFIQALDTGEVANTCHSSEGFIVVQYIIFLLPPFYFWVVLTQRFRFVKFSPMNCKIFTISTTLMVCGFASTILGSYTSQSNAANILWLVIVGISTIFLFWFDTVLDWKIFDGDARYPYLRDELGLGGPLVYWVIVVIHFITGLAWMMSIQQFSLMKTTLVAHIIILVSGILSMVRALLYNLVAVESIVTIQMTEYPILNDYNLPFSFPLDLNNSSLRKLVNEQYYEVMSKVPPNVNLDPLLYTSVPSKPKFQDFHNPSAMKFKSDSDFFKVLIKDYLEELTKSRKIVLSLDPNMPNEVPPNTPIHITQSDQDQLNVRKYTTNNLLEKNWDEDLQEHLETVPQEMIPMNLHSERSIGLPQSLADSGDHSFYMAHRTINPSLFKKKSKSD